MRLNDTIDKIVTVYLAGVCREEFEYKNKRFFPRPLYVSPLVLRGFGCPTDCGACCGRFSLDYLPGETRIDEASARTISFNRKDISVLSDMQTDVDGSWCRNLMQESGRCAVHSRRPFACDFELIRFIHERRRVIITQKLYGRAWAMKRLDGGKGALCYMTDATPETRAEVGRKFARLAVWATHFGIETCIPAIQNWVQTTKSSSPLILGAACGRWH